MSRPRFARRRGQRASTPPLLPRQILPISGECHKKKRKRVRALPKSTQRWLVLAIPAKQLGGFRSHHKLIRDLDREIGETQAYSAQRGRELGSVDDPNQAYRVLTGGSDGDVAARRHSVERLSLLSVELDSWTQQS
jgi:hypothetical protein